jgi:hypothetical protein
LVAIELFQTTAGRITKAQASGEIKRACGIDRAAARCDLN